MLCQMTKLHNDWLVVVLISMHGFQKIWQFEFFYYSMYIKRFVISPHLRSATDNPEQIKIKSFSFITQLSMLIVII